MEKHMRYVGLFIMLFAVGCTSNVNHPATPTNDSPVAVITPSVDPPARSDSRELHGQRFRVETVAAGLREPWALAWLDDERLIFTQRGGELCIVESDGVRRLHRFDQVVPFEGGGSFIHNGGLMGLAVSPTFSRDGLIYISYTGLAGNVVRNIIARARLAPDALLNAQNDVPVTVTQFRVLLNAMPAMDVHNGLPLRFGPDGMLWALTGDAGKPNIVHQRDQLGGKLLRMTPDGRVPRDNPFSHSLVWTMGHRHGLGFDWHPVNGELYATEQASAESDLMVNSRDSLFHIRKGRAYNAFRADHAGRLNPEPPTHTWIQSVGPAGAAFYTGDAFPAWRNRLFVATLSGQALMCITISEDNPAVVTDVSAVLVGEFGRLHTVALGPDGCVYIATANGENDRIIRLSPE
jgi:glucose/arabinose dehydrogenase